MNRLRIYIAALLVLLVAAFAMACGGDDKTIATGDGGEVTFSGDLPDEFPDDFPVYDGADLQGSYRGESEGVEGIVATWTTGDSIDDVAAFYERELDGDNWKIESQGSQGSFGSFYFALNSDESKMAYVLISRSDDETTILVTVGDNDGSVPGGDDSSGDDDSGDGSSGDDSGDDGSGDDGSGDDGSSGSADLPDEQDLPDDFPSDRVPLPSGARVTSSSSLSSGGTDTHFVEFYSQQSADELADYFKSELADKGWTESLTSESNGEMFLSFSEGEAGTAGVTIIIADSPVDGYRLVTVSVFGTS